MGNHKFRGIQKYTPSKIILGIISIKDLRQAVETAKRLEKINRQLSRQSSSNPFKSIKDNHSRRITFYTWDGLEDKIDRLSIMMGNKSNRQFKPQIYQSKRRWQNR